MKASAGVGEDAGKRSASGLPDENVCTEDDDDDDI